MEVEDERQSCHPVVTGMKQMVLLMPPRHLPEEWSALAAGSTRLCRAACQLGFALLMGLRWLHTAAC